MYVFWVFSSRINSFPGSWKYFFFFFLPVIKYCIPNSTIYYSICFAGAVFVNGKEMTNQLPAVTIGSAITFDMEVVNVFPANNNPTDVNSFKLRVTIGSGSREVVFDWLLDQVMDCLFFGCSFTQPGWKVLVFWCAFVIFVSCQSCLQCFLTHTFCHKVELFLYYRLALNRHVKSWTPTTFFLLQHQAH